MARRKSKSKWPADEVTRRKVAELIPYARNARTHSAEQIAQVAASIQEWGWTTPVLTDEDGGIIAGHCRVLAAQTIGIEEVPCMTATGWTEAQKRAYVLADNKLAMNADWDDDLLKIELGDLDELDFDMSLIGWDESELDLIMAAGDGLTEGQPSGAGSLAEQFLIPPFSVLNAREGRWQDR